MIAAPLQEIAQRVGEQMLSPELAKSAALPRVLRMFSASDLSETERLEMAYMLQKMILEGFLRGVNVVGMLEQRAQKEGMLHIGFHGGPVPHRNTIQFDREQWRTQPAQFRVGEFLSKAGTRLASRFDASPPPAASGAVRHSRVLDKRTGPLLSPIAHRVMNSIASRVIRTVAPARMGQIFDSMKQAQRFQGVAPPMPAMSSHMAMQVAKQPMEERFEEQHSAMTDAMVTREDLVRQGMNPVSVQMMQPRSGIGSPRQVGPMENPATMAAAGGRPQRMLIYNGPGTWSHEVAQTKANLDALGIGYDVVKSLSGVDYSKYGAFWMPGGNAGSEWNGGSTTEWNRLRQAINDGLNYYGNCAGAFFVGKWGSGGLGLQNVLIDYPQKSFPGGGSQVATPIKYWDGSTREATFYGGPGLDRIQGRTLGTFAGTGEAAIKSFDYGKGHVIIDAFHPSVETSGDDDGSDDAWNKKMLQAIMAGVDPDGAVPPPGTPPGGTPPGGGNVDVTNTTINPPIVNTGAGAFATIGSSSPRRPKPARKTPVAGMLPEGAVSNPFAAGLQEILQRGSAPLQSMAGSLQSIRGY